jgi:hypothetical protein
MIDKRKKAEMDRLLTKAQQDADVLAVLLFGSVVRQEKTPLSDIDICLVLVPHSETYEATMLSHKRLDYVKDFSFDVRIFQQLPLHVRRRVLKEGRVLFVRDEKLLYDIAFRTAQAFEDFKHIYYSYLKEVKAGGS